MRIRKKRLEICGAGSYNIDNTPATPLAARPSATGQVVSYNSTRPAAGRKAMLKSAGLVFCGALLEFVNFVCYTISNKPATPPNLRVSAHFRQAFSFLGFPYKIWKAHFVYADDMSPKEGEFPLHARGWW